jgi:uncharacterized protein YihD (DUF1040 family)
MRDENRIDRILDVIRGYWKAYPDLRLSQVLVEACRVAGAKEHRALEPAPGIFYTEDDALEQALRAMCACGDQK